MASSGPDGLVVVDKDQGMTSHDVVARVRRLANTRKVGHAGTLDPMATGVLCLGLGQATRLLRYVVGTDKEYEATIRLGIQTSTDDAEGEVVAARGAGPLLADAGPPPAGAGVEPDGGVLARIDAEIAKLTGRIDQVPSTVSAVKVGGRRAYELARAGQDVALEPRPVEVFAFERLTTVTAVATDAGSEPAEGRKLGDGRERGDGSEPSEGSEQAERGELTVIDLDVRVVCSAGTYVRALARDLGRALGTGGHLTRLRRTRVGAWGLQDARRLDDLAGSDGGLPTVGLPGLCAGLFPRVDVSEREAQDLALGRFIPGRPWGAAPSHVRDTAAAWCADTPVALVSARGSQLKPDLQLRPHP